MRGPEKVLNPRSSATDDESYIVATKLLREAFVIIRNLSCIWTLLSLGLCLPVASAQLRVVVDHVGYEPDAQKVALVVVSDSDPAPESFAVIDPSTGKAVFSGQLNSAGTVNRWTGRGF